MGKLYSSEVVINKSKKEVWDFISDFYSYHEWSPYFLGLRSKKIDINEIDQKVRGYFKSESRGILMYNALITNYEVEKVISWKGKMIIPFGCFLEQSFNLEEIDENTTKLLIENNFSGFSVGLMKKRYFERLQEGFDSLCTNAKERIENPEKFVKEEETEVKLETNSEEENK